MTMDNKVEWMFYFKGNPIGWNSVYASTHKEACEEADGRFIPIGLYPDHSTMKKVSENIDEYKRLLSLFD